MQKIDKLIPLDTAKGVNVTIGQRVSAMILNGLGFVDDRLYLFPKFLANKPVEDLFGSGACAEYFNADALGRALDSIHEYGETNFYSNLALEIGLEQKILGKSCHLDTTTLSLYGEYADSEQANIARDKVQTLCGKLLPKEGNTEKIGVVLDLLKMIPLRLTQYS